jgi:hypothetical protein
MKTISGTMSKLPVKIANGSIDLIDMDAIFYLEAKEGDTLNRTNRRFNNLTHTETLALCVARLSRKTISRTKDR